MKTIACSLALSAVLLLALSAAPSMLPPASAQSDGRIIYEKNSRYHQIYVFQEGSVRSLVFGRRKAPNIQSRIDMKNPRRHMLEYSQLAFCGLLYVPEPRHVMVMGLGGGVIPTEMHHYLPETFVDVVEIDPEVLIVAQNFFGFKTDERLKVHVRDGRMYVRDFAKNSPQFKYDIIVLDAFNSDYIPFHLMTREFLEQVQAALSDDGVVVANVFSFNRLFDAELATYLDVFGRAHVYFGLKSGNAMIVAPGKNARLLTAEEAAQRAAALQEKHKFAFDIRFVAERLQTNVTPRKGAFVLSDDKAPVNLLRAQETGE
jgi:spermidine synthase